MNKKLNDLELFCSRLTKLRMNKGVSARDMSLSLGQNPGYINAIESGKSLPTIPSLLNICEYFKISVSQYFSYDFDYPVEIQLLIMYSRKMSSKKLHCLLDVAKYLSENS